MVNIIISFLTFALIIISLFMVLVILMQRANTSGGMGSAFGGGVTESAFGAETTNILTRATKYSAIAFFSIALVLYLLYMSREGRLAQTTDVDLPDIPVAVETPPAEELPVVSENDSTTGTQTIADELTQTLPKESESLSQEVTEELPPVEEPVTVPTP